jgi:hypothetical protein
MPASTSVANISPQRMRAPRPPSPPTSLPHVLRFTHNSVAAFFSPLPPAGEGLGERVIARETVLTVTLPCRARTGLQACTVQQADDTSSATPASPPSPSSGPHDLACKPNRLRQRRACSAKTLPRPTRGRGEHGTSDLWVNLSPYVGEGSIWSRRATSTLVCAALLLVAADAAAQQPMVYPAKGQSPDKQSQDDAACNSWAKQSSGVDPVQMAGAAQQSPAPGGERARSAARGAVGGAAIGAIAGDAGKGAGVGAVAGTMYGGRQSRQKHAAQGQQAMDAYFRAYGACMSGRGYSVK